MARSRLSLLMLLLLPAAGCTLLVADSGDPNAILPAKTPEKPKSLEKNGGEAPQPVVVKKIQGGKIAGAMYPPVLLSTFHAKWCSRQVGDQFPELELPQLGGRKTKLATLFGTEATVVIYWHEDRWMSQMVLEDVQREVVDKFDTAKVSVVGVPVEVSPAKVRRRVQQVKVGFPQLLDSQGNALSEVGSVALPRIYVLDPTGKIVWFDIEYSEGTRREMLRTLALLAKGR